MIRIFGMLLSADALQHQLIMLHDDGRTD